MESKLLKSHCTRNYNAMDENLKGFAAQPWQTMTRAKLDEETHWIHEPSVLWQQWKTFIPRSFMTKTEKINSGMRLGIYVAVVMLFSNAIGRAFAIFIPILVGIMGYYIHDENNGLFLKDAYHADPQHQIKTPTQHNPFMNTLLTEIGKGPTGIAADISEPVVQKEMDEMFEEGLYFDIQDVYRKNNSQNRFFTMPNTNEYGVKNGDTALFANWLYNKPAPTCKEDGRFCTNNYATTFDNFTTLASQRQFY